MFYRFPLESWERQFGIAWGRYRMQRSIERGLSDRNGAERKLHLDVMGALGELAFCKAVGLFQVRNGQRLYPLLTVDVDKSTPDFGKNIQVRTRSKQDYNLNVRHDDVDDHIYVVTIQGSQLWTVKGWMYGREAKNDNWLGDPNGRGAMYLVPDEVLHDISEIPKESFEGVRWPEP